MRVDVFKGWVELRDPELVTENQRKPVFALITANMDVAEDSKEAVAMSFDVLDATAVALVESWSFDAEISVTGMGDLLGKTVDDIRRVCIPFVNKLMPNFDVNAESIENPKAPTAN